MHSKCLYFPIILAACGFKTFVSLLFGVAIKKQADISTKLAVV